MVRVQYVYLERLEETIIVIRHNLGHSTMCILSDTYLLFTICIYQYVPTVNSKHPFHQSVHMCLSMYYAPSRSLRKKVHTSLYQQRIYISSAITIVKFKAQKLLSIFEQRNRIALEEDFKQWQELTEQDCERTMQANQQLASSVYVFKNPR